MNDRNVGYEERLTALEKKLDSIIPALDGLNSLATELHRLVTEELNCSREAMLELNRKLELIVQYHHGWETINKVLDEDKGDEK